MKNFKPQERLVITEEEIENFTQLTGVSAIKANIRQMYYTKLNLPDMQQVVHDFVYLYHKEDSAAITEFLENCELAADYTGKIVNLVADVAQKSTKLGNGITPANCGYNIFSVDGLPVIKPKNRPIETIDLLPRSHAEVLKQHMNGDVTLEQAKELLQEFGGLHPYINQNLPTDIVLSFQEDFAALARDCRYDSLSNLLDFIHFVRQIRLKNPQLSFSDIHSLYELDITRNVYLHRGNGDFGGDCLDMTAVFIDYMKKIYNITAVPILYFNHNPMTVLHDSEGNQREWTESIKQIQYSHMAAGIHFTLPTGELMLAHYEMGVGTIAKPNIYMYEPRSLLGEYFLYEPKQQFANRNVSWNAAITGNGKYSDIYSVPHHTMDPNQIGRLIENHLPAHIQTVVHENAEENYGKFSSSAFRFNFHTGLIRVTSSELSSLRALYIDGQDYLHQAEAIAEEDSDASSFPTTISHDAKDRSKVTKRKDNLYQIRFDFDYFANNPHKKVEMYYASGVYEIVPARIATEVFLTEVAIRRQFRSEFVADCMYMFDNWQELQSSFFYSR